MLIVGPEGRRVDRRCAQRRQIGGRAEQAPVALGDLVDDDIDRDRRPAAQMTAQDRGGALDQPALGNRVEPARDDVDLKADDRRGRRPPAHEHRIGGIVVEIGPHGAFHERRLRQRLAGGLLRQVYGDGVGSDALFLQHTYLTILVKAIAARVLDLEVDDPAEMLSGRLLTNEGIVGAVEADFFDWPLLAEGGDELVRSLAGETVRFRLRDVEVDVLKSLYESLIDPDERHDLGEYYTPDWLAARVSHAPEILSCRNA